MRRYRFHLLTSDGHLSHTPRSEFDNDDHAIVFADGLLRAAEPQVASIEVWHERDLLFKRERRE